MQETSFRVLGLPEGRESGLFLSRGKGIHPDRTMDDWELILVRRGRLPIAEDAADVSVSAGEALVLRPGRRHRGTAPYAPDLEFHWLHFRLPRRGKDLLRAPLRARPARVGAMAELFHRYHDEAASGALAPAAAGALVLLLLAELARPAAAEADADATLAARAEAWIARNFHKPISTSDVARALDRHPDHIGRAFRSAFGRTVVDEIRRRRLEDARRLLIEDPRPQEAIARECGFADARYFRRVFRRALGVTPEAFRRRHARGFVNSR